MIVCLAFFFMQGKLLFACDGCGCSVSGSYSGLMAFNTNNFIGLRYANYHFNTSENGFRLQAGFQALDLLTAFKINDKWQVMAYLPYKLIDYAATDTKANLNGFADAGVLNTFRIYSNSKVLMRKNTQTLYVKAGLELPTGKFNNEFRAEHLPASIATGSGSFDLMTGLQYKFQNKSFNLFADYSYKHALIDGTNYHFGGQHSVSVIISDPVVKNKFTINPYYGITSEFLSSDKYYKMEMTGTNGVQLFINSGFEFQAGKWSMGINYDIPVYARFDDETQGAAYRIATRLNYGF